MLLLFDIYITKVNIINFENGTMDQNIMTVYFQ